MKFTKLLAFTVIFVFFLVSVQVSHANFVPPQVCNPGERFACLDGENDYECDADGMDWSSKGPSDSCNSNAVTPEPEPSGVCTPGNRFSCMDGFNDFVCDADGQDWSSAGPGDCGCGTKEEKDRFLADNNGDHHRLPDVFSCSGGDDDDDRDDDDGDDRRISVRDNREVCASQDEIDRFIEDNNGDEHRLPDVFPCKDGESGTNVCASQEDIDRFLRENSGDEHRLPSAFPCGNVDICATQEEIDRFIEDNNGDEHRLPDVFACRDEDDDDNGDDGGDGRDEGNGGAQIQSQNNAPTLNSIGNKNVNEDSNLQFSVSGSDPDGDSLSFSASNLPSGASFSGQAFSWTPIFSQVGTHTVTFTVSDGQTTDSETITITVTGVNDLPLINIPDVSVTEDSGLNNNLIGLSSFVSDEEDPFSSLTLSITSQSNTGVVSCSIDTTNFVDCTTVLDQNGFSDVTVSATDTGSLSSSDTFRVTVTPVNDAPVNQIISPIGTFVEGIALLVSGTASDVDNSPLSFIFNFGDGTSIVGNIINQILSTKIYNKPGLFNLSFSVSDGALTSVATTQVTILPFSFSIIADKTSGEEPLEVTFDVIHNGGNGPFSYSWDFNNDGVTGSTIKNPSAIFKEEGKFIVTLIVTDADGDTAINTVTINVEKGHTKLSRKKIHVSQIRFLEEVQAGDDLEVLINLENKDVLKTKELSVSVLVPELGLRKKVGNEKLRSEEEDSKRVLIKIPNETKPGIYDVLITVNDHDTNRRIWRELRVI